jgi:hypothetical protein
VLLPFIFFLATLAIVMVHGAAASVAWRMYRDRKREVARSVLTLGGVVKGTAVFIVLNVISFFPGCVMAELAVSGESVDPTQKARILAQGISEAMNCTAVGALALTLPSAAFVVYAAVRDRRLQSTNLLR